MAGLASNVVTLMDVAKRLEPNGKVAKIVELLSNTNPILQDMHWMEGNLPTGHRTTVRTGLPTVAWRLLNAGTSVSKSTTAQVDEACGMLEAWSRTDEKVAKLNGNLNAFRLSEASAFVEAMNQEMASTLFYGNTATAPEEFLGLAPRYADLSAANGQNIIDAGGTGSDNSSIWLVVWGPQTVHGIYPKGSKAGLSHKDHGLQIAELTAGIGASLMSAYTDQWNWDCGVALRDWRYAVRIANVDISNLAAKSSDADLIESMIKAYHRIVSMGMGRPVFYMNRSCAQYLHIQRRDDVISGGGLGLNNAEGAPMMKFLGIPIRVCDALTEAESQVS